MFRKGEKVRFLNEMGEATVLRVLDNGMVEVRDQFGLEVSYAARELVRIGESSASTVAPAKVVETPKPIPAPQPTVSAEEKEQSSLPELALLFLSENMSAPETGDLELFFHNGSEYHMLVNIAAKEAQGLFSLFRGEVRAGQMQSIRPIRRQDVDIFGLTVVDCIFFKDADYVHREAFSATLKLKATRFVKPGGYRLVSSIGGQAMVVPVERPRASVSEAAVHVQPRRAVRSLKKALPKFEDEIDLHIECLTGDFSLMSNHEMLMHQMRCFERELNHAITRNYVQIVFIHGVGKGRLKDEIRKALKDYGHRYEDAPYHKYGAGATLVLLKG